MDGLRKRRKALLCRRLERREGAFRFEGAELGAIQNFPRKGSFE
jgi:hypothetical protein